MATSNTDFNVNFINCALCFEKYKTPRNLPCKHVLCHNCLSAHIKATYDKFCSPPLGFSCPICRTFIPAPGVLGQYPVEDWANHFTENMFFNFKADKLASLSNVTCGPCKTGGENDVQAENWCMECADALCKKCTQVHKNFKALITHQIFSLNTTELSVSKESKKVMNNLDCCEKHEKRNIELICETHQALCCCLCIIQEHKQCENFSTITQAAEACLEEKKKIVEDIKHFSAKIDLLLQDEKQNITELETKMETDSDEIRKMIEEMVNQLRNREEKYLNKLAEASKEGKRKLQDSVGSLEHRKMYLAYWLEILTTNTEDQTKEGIIIKCLKTKEAMKEIICLPLIRTNFNVAVEIPSGIHKINSLGTLFNVETTENNVNLNDIKNSTIDELEEFETECARIYGGCFLPNGRLLLCDSSSPRCLIFMENGTLAQEIGIPGNPWDAFIESDGRILITLPADQKLVVLLQNTLAVEDTIDLSCSCSSIAKLQDRYLFGSSGSFEEFNFEFNHLESLSVDITDDIAVDKKGCIVFGDYDKNKITKENKDHTVMFTYNHRELINICGLAVDRYGFIFVNGRSSDNIHILSEDGELLKMLDFKSPQCIKFEEKSSRFFVVSSEGVVKILKTSW